MDKDLERLAAEARREYFRKWRAENPEKVRKHNQNYWKKKALELQEERSKKND